MIARKEAASVEFPVRQRTAASREADEARRGKVARRIFGDVPAEFSDYRRFAPGKSVQDVRFAFQRAAIRDERLTAWERLFLVFIVERFVVADRRATATDQLVRNALGIGKRTIERARAHLEEIGLIWTRGGTGKGDPLVYFLRVEGLFVSGTVATEDDPQTPPVATSTSERTSKKGLQEEDSSPPSIIESLRDRRPSDALEVIASEIEAAPTMTEAAARFVALSPAVHRLIGPRRLGNAQVVDRLMRASRAVAGRPRGDDPAAPARLSWLPLQFEAPRRW